MVLRRVTVFAGALWIALLAGCSRSPQQYVETGNKSFEAKKYDEALLNYRKAIQQDANYAEGYYRLGLTLLAQKDERAAAAVLQKALELDPKKTDAAIRLGDLQLGILLTNEQHPKAAYESLTKITAGLLAANPNSYEGLRYQGHLSLLDGKVAEALASFEKADKLKPNQPELLLAIAEAKVQSGQLAEGEKIAANLIEKQKDYGQAYDFLQLKYVKAGRAADAERIVKAKADNNPNNLEYQIQLAGYYLVAKKRPEADKIFARVTADAKTFPDANLRIGELWQSLRMDADAVKYLEQGLKADASKKAEYQRLLAPSLWATGKKKETLDLLDDLLKAAPKDQAGLRLRAAYRAQQGSPQDLDVAEADYKVLLAEQPRDAALHFQYGLVRRLKKDNEQASNEFQEAIRLNPKYLAPRLALAEILGQRGQYAEGLRQLDAIVSLDPDNPRIRMLRAATLRNLGRFSEARTDLNRAQRVAPNDLDVQIESGLLDFSDNKLKQAEQTFTKIYKPGSSDGRAVMGLARVYTAQKQYDKALNLLKSEVQKNPSIEGARRALADLALRAGKPEVAIDQLRDLVKSDPKNAVTQAELGHLLIDTGEKDEAIGLLRKAGESTQADPQLQLSVATGLQRAGRNDEAKGIYEKLLKADPRNALALNNLAYLKAEAGTDLDEALRLAQAATQRQPENKNFTDTVGIVYLKKGMTDTALQTFQALVRSEPSNAGFRVHLAMALLDKGNKKAAQTELESALRQSPTREDAEQIRDLMAKAKSN